MREETRDIILDHVQRTERERGLDVPPHIQQYVVSLLVDYLDKPERLPDCSVCELLLKANGARELKDVGDLCLWITGVMPTYRQHRGMTRSYYIELGRSAYSGTSAWVLSDIANRFEPVSNYVYLVTHLPQDNVPQVKEILDRFF